MDMPDMHKAAPIIEHTGVDLFITLLYECDRAVLCILIHRIKTE